MHATECCGAKQSGFTMVELLIVIVILGILAAIVVFAVGHTTGNAASQACRTEAKQFVNAYVGYQAKHAGAEVTDATTQLKAATLASEGLLSSASLQYLSPVAGQGGTVATATSARWTFSTAPVAVDVQSC